MNNLNQAELQDQHHLSYAGTSELWQIERSLPNYNLFLIRLFSQFLKGKERILEFGAGIGTLAKLWESTQNHKPTVIEIDPALQLILKQRGLNCFSKLDDLESCVEGIYSSNVLEHIENDDEILKSLYQKLCPQGVLIIFVPAFMSLYSHLDLSVGHYRRYHKNELIKKLEDAQFRIITAKYCDSIGFLAWFWMKFSSSRGESTLDSKKLVIYDRFIFPISKLLDKIGLQYLFGKNLFVVAKK